MHIVLIGYAYVVLVMAVAAGSWPRGLGLAFVLLVAPLGIMIGLGRLRRRAGNADHRRNPT